MLGALGKRSRTDELLAQVFVTRTVLQEPRVGTDLVATQEFRFRAYSKANATIRVLGGRVTPAETCGLLSKHTEVI